MYLMSCIDRPTKWEPSKLTENDQKLMIIDRPKNAVKTRQPTNACTCTCSLRHILHYIYKRYIYIKCYTNIAFNYEVLKTWKGYIDPSTQYKSSNILGYLPEDKHI